VGNLQLLGGARLNNGVFETWISISGGKFFFTDSPIKSYIEEHFNFLIGDENTRVLTPDYTMTRGTSRGKGLPMTTFTDPLGCKWTMYKKEGNYCVLVMELPAQMRAFAVIGNPAADAPSEDDDGDSGYYGEG
jgi:hypothetical protein